MNESTEHPVSPEESLRQRLRELIDPELGINIVDLGLIYSIRVEGNAVEIEMTLTSSVCPIGEALVAAVRHIASETPGIETVSVNLIWDPPWTPAMLSPAAREELETMESILE